MGCIMPKGTNQKLKLDMRYTHILYDNPDLSLEVIYMLDKVQKGQGKELSNEDIKLLRKKQHSLQDLKIMPS